jgi:5-methylcytosine-specific restriction endonuclease McrA
LARINEDDHERLLPAQVTLLMNLKNLKVEEKDVGRTQRKLKPGELAEIFEKLNPERKFHLTKREWRTWCAHFNVLPVTDPDATKKQRGVADDEGNTETKSDDNAVEHPSSTGRARFCRPALRILKELLLSGDAPGVLYAKLSQNRLPLHIRSSPTNEKLIRIFANTGDPTRDKKNASQGLLVSDLGFLLRMGKAGQPADNWDDLFIPNQQLDRLAQEADASMEERTDAIRSLIGKQNNPIVRHRLETFWKRLQKLEERFGIPTRIVLEFVRDDSETSWLGKEAASQITDAQKKQRERRERARRMLAEMDQPNGDVLKYLLWESQGGQCLYGKPSGEAKCPYTATGLKFTDLDQHRIDHIVPRAKGGPDSFSNRILTTDDTNAAKGDRTPWQWFRQNRTLEDWDAYKTRVLARTKELGWKKTRLLLDADAEKLVERYNPLAETAWIARLAQTVASLHFGWANGNDSDGKKRVIAVSGGLTGRIRRKYFLNSLLGRDRELDKKITEKLDALTALRNSSLDREERKPQTGALRAELDELGSESLKSRDDKRHHALDAMVLSFFQPRDNDPNREEEFRFTAFGDNPTFAPERAPEVGELRRRIIALGAAADGAATKEDRDRIHRQITMCRDGLASLRLPRNELAVREVFRRLIDGDPTTQPILPRHLHFPKPRLEATFHRGVWLRMESESRATKASIDDFDTAYKRERVPLLDLPFQKNPHTETIKYVSSHALRRITGIIAHKDYDAKAVRLRVESFLRINPTETQWRAWCVSDDAPQGVKPKKGKPNKRELAIYCLEEKRTKRVPLYDLGVGSNEVAAYDRNQFVLQASRLVRRPERGRDKPEIPLETDELLQNKLCQLQPAIEAFYAKYPPDLGKRPNKEAEGTAWETQRENAKNAWEEFIKQNGLDQHKRVYLRTDSASPTERRYERASISSVLLTRMKRFERSQAEKQAKSISDCWTRFQLREFLKRDPGQAEWQAFCDAVVQVKKKDFARFLERQPNSATEFVEFYREQRSGSSLPKYPRNRVLKVHQVIGNAHDYIDVSKDGSGIYAKGGNRGYLIWKHTHPKTDEITWGAKSVRAFLRLADVKRLLLNQPGTELIDREQKLWQTNMLLHLPQATQSGKKLVPAGYYYFGSISNEAFATLKPLAGGDVFDGISVSLLLQHGLSRVSDNQFSDTKP